MDLLKRIGFFKYISGFVLGFVVYGLINIGVYAEKIRTLERDVETGKESDKEQREMIIETGKEIRAELREIRIEISKTKYN